jgi:hypothetical protein
MTRWLLSTVFGLLMLAVPAAAQDLTGTTNGEPDATAEQNESRAAGQVGTPLPRPIVDLSMREYLLRARPPARRPAALPALYATLAGLNALDAYTTVRALQAGAREANPLVAPTAGHFGTSLAVKAVSTAASIYLAESLWKKNRAAAVVTIIAVNGATAAVAAHNLRNAR